MVFTTVSYTHLDVYKRQANKLKLLPTFFHETEETVRQRSENVLSDKIKFLFIGTLDEKKGLYDLLEVLASLKQNYSNFLLNIVGGVSIQEQEKVKRLISEKQLEKYITFEPFRNDGNIFSAYTNANVVVLPSRIYENLPNTLICLLYTSSRYYLFALSYFVLRRLTKEEISSILKILFCIVIFQSILFTIQGFTGIALLIGAESHKSAKLITRFYNSPLMLYFFVFYGIFNNPFTGKYKYISALICIVCVYMPLHLSLIHILAFPSIIEN